MFDFLFSIIIGNNVTNSLPNGKNIVISKAVSPNQAPTVDINDRIVTFTSNQKKN